MTCVLLVSFMSVEFIVTWLSTMFPAWRWVCVCPWKAIHEYPLHLCFGLTNLHTYICHSTACTCYVYQNFPNASMTCRVFRLPLYLWKRYHPVFWYHDYIVHNTSRTNIPTACALQEVYIIMLLIYYCVHKCTHMQRELQTHCKLSVCFWVIARLQYNVPSYN